ncbi:MAG TPA: tryptophan synthase subunit alpha [Alphaproteobacteria bacterium]|nr:tryptophan synthase subunit alpha [Alphaproteobacteria bacterium]
MERLNKIFSELKAKNKKAFVSYIMGHDPDEKTCLKILHGFVAEGVDILEIGLPFSDPMAEGPIIQKAAERVLAQNVTQKKILELVIRFREKNSETPVILMGYFNPIYHYGIENFVEESKAAGADGFIIVDLPPEEDSEFVKLTQTFGLSLIKLTTPTTDKIRAEKILKTSSGFVYHVSVAGVTGQKDADIKQAEEKVKLIKSVKDIPVCIGFGIKTPEQAKEAAKMADGVVIGSAFVKIIEENLSNTQKMVENCINLAKFVRDVL